MRTLALIIVVLAAIDGLIHLLLDVLVFHSLTRNLFSELFILNFIGYVAIIAFFVLSQGASLSRQKLATIVMVVYPVVTFLAWIYMTKGRGNPLGFADISKPVEVLLAIVAIVYFIQLGKENTRTVGIARS